MIILHEKLLESESKKQSNSASPSAFFKSKWIEENLLIQNFKKKSLDGYKKVLHSLNLKKPKEIILIGGTNGKGSLSELITKLALKRNVSVGTYTSPHLLNFNERIRLNDKEISEEDYKKVLNQCDLSKFIDS